jgi:hypothetical protein
MKSCVVNVSMGKRYERLQPRLIESIKKNEDPVDIVAWLNNLPPQAPTGLQLPYLAYCAKSFAMLDAYKHGYELLLWVDSACVAIKHTRDIFNHIKYHGYYIQDNGWNVGQWSSDVCLNNMQINREDAFNIPEISTMIVGLNMKHDNCQEFLKMWCNYASDGESFIAPHTNDIGPAFEKGCAYREIGRVSEDNRVYGHRHDQTVASILAHKFNWKRTPRPIFADYYSKTPDPRTIFVNKG